MSEQVISMKIEKVYLDGIRNGVKKHEYRLYDEKRQAVTVGSYLELVNKDDETDKQLVKVTGFYVFRSWADALKNFWKEDFKGTYKTFKEAKKDCESFYSPEQVSHYGLVVFEIELA